MIIAGEVSGDLLGANLIDELKKLSPELLICGIGGDKMKNAGMELIYHINKMAFLGITEIIKHLPLVRKVKADIIKRVKADRINNVVLIDYPGFNLSIAKEMKKLNVNIIYYISPQIWAWGAARIKKIKRLVKKMIVVFPFEEVLYKENSVNVEFVGHPLIDRINDYRFLSKQELYTQLQIDEGKEILLLLPGSRVNEIVKIFPHCLKAAKKLAADFNLQIVTACASNIDENFIYQLSGSENLKVVKGLTYDLMKHAKFGIVKSGTSTLEAALFSLPMVIVYKTSSLTYLIGKKLVKLESIGMANIISGEKVVPELIQRDVNAEKIYNECSRILDDDTTCSSIKTKLEKVKEKLTPSHSEGASAKAAKSIYAIMNEN